MSKFTKQRKAHQCVACGFNATRGSFVREHEFLCRACENEFIGEDEQRHVDEEWAELSRIEYRLGNCEYM